MESPKHLWCYKCDRGIVYFAENGESDDTNSSSTSANASPSSKRSTRRAASSFPIALSPHKWKSAQSILKSTPIWHESMNGGMCGLQNLGNTCFMNASLQALLHCPAVAYMFTLPEVWYMKPPNRINIVDEFIKLTYQMWEGKHRNLIPRDMLRCIMHKYVQFRGYGQQDAHEFLTCLLHFLHDEYKYSIASKDKEDKDSKETSLIYDLFGGEMVSCVECLRCHTKSTKIEHMTDIQVEIPKQEQVDRAVKERQAKPLPSKGWLHTMFTVVGLQSQTIPLSLCLHSYCTSEDLLNAEKYHCESCKSKQDAKKTLLIRKLPEILMVQIKRFSHDSSWRGSSKVSTHVSFPIDALDLKQYIHPQHIRDPHNKDTKYDLCSLVKHMGSTGGGHYVAFAKHPASAKWYKFDDSRVEQVSPDKLHEQQAYILFYTRRKCERSYLKSIANTLAVSQQLSSSDNKSQQVLLSRYWLHRVQAFSRPGPIDNLWFSCPHGSPLSRTHPRSQHCAITIPYNTWLELSKKYGLHYNAAMCTQQAEEEEPKQEEDEEEEEEQQGVIPPWALSVSSQHCDECAKEALNRRREYEKHEIRRLEEDGCPHDCALNMKWATQWRNFVHNKTDTVPGSINNDHIHAGNHCLKQELIKDTDYLMIPSNIWTFLLETYGGSGPKIVPTTTKQKEKSRSPSSNDSTQSSSK